jgi:enterochelin esterase-like enzyme
MSDWKRLILIGLWACLAACAPAAARAASSTVTASPAQVSARPTTAGPTTPSVTPGPSLTPSATLYPSLTPRPTRTPAPTPCAEPHGTVSAISVPSDVLNYPIDAQLYLPPCYAVSGVAYPVLYLIHGLGFTNTQWVKLGAPLQADALSAAGEIAPLIIVMPSERKDVRFDPAFVVDLVPYIDANYRTLADHRYRAIGGLSRGGGWAVHLGLRYPQLFGRIGAHSPAVFFGDENNVLAYARGVDKTGPVPALYIDIGDQDPNRQSAVWLNQVATWFSFGQTFLVQPGNHTEAYWSAHLPDYLRFYAAAWRPGQETPTPTATATPGFQ